MTPREGFVSLWKEKEKTRWPVVTPLRGEGADLAAALAGVEWNTPCAGRWGQWQSPNRWGRLQAVVACQACPVLEECRAAVGEKGTGVWGGIDTGWETQT